MDILRLLAFSAIALVAISAIVVAAEQEPDFSAELPRSATLSPVTPAPTTTTSHRRASSSIGGSTSSGCRSRQSDSLVIGGRAVVGLAGRGPYLPVPTCRSGTPETPCRWGLHASRRRCSLTRQPRHLAPRWSRPGCCLLSGWGGLTSARSVDLPACVDASRRRHRGAASDESSNCPRRPSLEAPVCSSACRERGQYPPRRCAC